MTHSDLEFLDCILGKVSSGLDLTRDVVADCYEKTGSRDGKESTSVAGNWIDYYLKELLAIPRNELREAKGSRKKMAAILHKIWA